jgi:hypothetical protein
MGRTDVRRCEHPAVACAMRRAFKVGFMLLTVLALRGPAQMVQSAGDVVLVPSMGVALATSNGEVRWRCERFQGQVLAAKNNGFVVTRLFSKNKRLHFDTYRICRERARDGHRDWCRDVVFLRYLVFDGDQIIYVLTRSSLMALNLAHGRTLWSFELEPHSTASLVVALGRPYLIEADPSSTTIVQPGPGKRVTTRIAVQSYTFSGRDGEGAVLLDEAHRSLLLPPDWHSSARLAISLSSFPSAAVGATGFAMSGRERDAAVIIGGPLEGPVWNVEGSPGPWRLAASSTAILAWTDPRAAAKCTVSAYEIASGKPVFRLQMPNLHFATAISDEDGWMLEGRNGSAYLDSGGRELWHDDSAAFRPEVFARGVVVGWDESRLVARSRSSGEVVWTVAFRDRPAATLP